MSDKSPILLIMAAGMGSRYGGLKQMDPVGPEGETILDYSVFDARRAGFRRVVFLIKHEIEADFRRLVGDRIARHMEVSYAFQEVTSLPEGYAVPEGRVKPYGTGHAVLRMENMIVPDSNRLGPVGEGLNEFIHALAVSRASIGVCLLGLSQRFLEMAIARANDRVTFGKKLIQRQAIQQTIADMATRVYSLRLLAHECAIKADKDEDIDMISSMLKLDAIDTVRVVSDSCLEIFGGIGYFEDNPYGPLERMYRDARAMWFEEGPRTVQRLTLVREVIEKKGELRCCNYY